MNLLETVSPIITTQIEKDEFENDRELVLDYFFINYLGFIGLLMLPSQSKIALNNYFKHTNLNDETSTDLAYATKLILDNTNFPVTTNKLANVIFLIKQRKITGANFNLSTLTHLFKTLNIQHTNFKPSVLLYQLLEKLKEKVISFEEFTIELIKLLHTPKYHHLGLQLLKIIKSDQFDVGIDSDNTPEDTKIIVKDIPEAKPEKTIDDIKQTLSWILERKLDRRDIEFVKGISQHNKELILSDTDFIESLNDLETHNMALFYNFMIAHEIKDDFLIKLIPYDLLFRIYSDGKHSSEATKQSLLSLITQNKETFFNVLSTEEIKDLLNSKIFISYNFIKNTTQLISSPHVKEIVDVFSDTVFAFSFYKHVIDYTADVSSSLRGMMNQHISLFTKEFFAYSADIVDKCVSTYIDNLSEYSKHADDVIRTLKYISPNTADIIIDSISKKSLMYQCINVHFAGFVSLQELLTSHIFNSILDHQIKYISTLDKIAILSNKYIDFTRKIENIRYIDDKLRKYGLSFYNNNNPKIMKLSKMYSSLLVEYYEANHTTDNLFQLIVNLLDGDYDGIWNVVILYIKDNNQFPDFGAPWVINIIDNISPELLKKTLTSDIINQIMESAQYSKPILEVFISRIHQFYDELDLGKNLELQLLIIGYSIKGATISKLSEEIHHDKHLIKPLTKIDNDALRKIFLYNDVDVKFIYNDIINNAKTVEEAKTAIDSIDISPLIISSNISAVNLSEMELKRTTIIFNKNHNHYKHDNISANVLGVMNCSIPVQLKNYQEFVKNHPDTEYLIPAFHGTGSIAASFITRYGFAVIKSRDSAIKISGKMLGDGIYMANNIDKALQYVGDSGFTRKKGTKGYIFEMRVALGKPNVDYAADGVKGFYAHNVVSPEWVVFKPNDQIEIYKIYFVEIQDKQFIDELISNNHQLGEAKMSSFKTFMKDKNYPQSYIVYIFQDGYIPVSEHESVFYDKYKPMNDNVHIEDNWVYIKTDQDSERRIVHTTQLFLHDTIKINEFLELTKHK
jgi:hypothetical protein